MNLLVIDKINQCINHFLQLYFEDLEIIADIGINFNCYIVKNYIEYALVISEKESNRFLKYLNKHYNCYTNNFFIIALLHEIFHIETYSDNNQFDFIITDLGKKLINWHLLPKSLYYKLPLERKSTAGAVKWINTHTNEIKNLVNELAPLFKEFYKLNNIIDD